VGTTYKQLIRRLQLLAIGLLLASGVLWPSLADRALAAPAFAGGDVVQEDVDQDGRPDITIIQASFSTNRDLVRVYDGGDNMRASAKWQQATDFKDDTWVFDYAGDGTAQLIIRFSTTGTTTTATLYTDQNKNGRVEYEADGSSIRILEPGFSPFQAVVEGDWTLPNGDLNWNVRFSTDGPFIYFLNGHNVSDYWSRSGYFVADGKPDAELAFADADHDGIPEYGIYRVVTPTPSGEGAPRTQAWANEGRHRPQQPTNTIFWPFLTTKDVQGIDQQRGIGIGTGNYFDSAPFISYSFNAAGIRLMAFQGYPIEQGYHINTLQYFSYNDMNYANFENAMGYYDLAGDKDNVPELHIRNRYFDRDDIYNDYVSAPTEEIRYSWNQSNDVGFAWDYKLGLVGHNEITETNEIAGFTYNGISYQKLPGWVTSNTWDYATFVAREGAQFQSTEGIYAWAPLERFYDGSTATLAHYVAGETVLDIRNAFPSADPGWRGDFAPELGAQARLYFSPVDHKLHLMNAQSGVWQIDDASRIHYANLGSGPYLDQLTYTREITGAQAFTITRQLDIAPGHLLYSDEQGIELRQARVASSLFETLPPTNHAEWQALGEKLEQNRGDTAPGDLHAMLAQFAGPTQRIAGATVRDYRPTSDSGFRFVLDLRANFSAEGADLIGVRGLQSGAYAVEYNGSFHVSPLTPPSIQAHASAAQLTQWQASTIQIALDNRGLEDVRGAVVEFVATQPGGEPTAVTSRTLDLLAGVPAEVGLPWTPNTAGEWSAYVQVRGPDGQELSNKALHYDIAAANATPQDVIRASVPPAIAIVAALSLVCMAILGTMIFWRQLSLARRKRASYEN
jgi:hypothetical protein